MSFSISSPQTNGNTCPYGTGNIRPRSSSYYREGRLQALKEPEGSVFALPFVQLCLQCVFFWSSCSSFRNVALYTPSSNFFLPYLNHEFRGAWLCFTMWTFMFLSQSTLIFLRVSANRIGTNNIQETATKPLILRYFESTFFLYTEKLPKQCHSNPN